MVSKRVSRILNTTKSKSIKMPQSTPLGSPGYDNPRDDIEKVKKLREGSVIKVPTEDIDIVNKLALDTEILTTWLKSLGQTGLTGDKTGSFNLTTTGLGTFGTGKFNGDVTYENGVVLNNPSDSEISWTGEAPSSQQTTFHIDFNDSAFGPTLYGKTTLIGSEILFFRGIIINHDDAQMQFGSAGDSGFEWDTAKTNDYLKLFVGTGSSARSGNVVFVDRDVVPVGAYPVEDNPTLRLQATSTDINNYIKFQHNGTNAIIQSGAGGIEFPNDIFFTGAGTGLIYGTMSVVSNANETTITTQNVYVQVTDFDTNGPSNNISTDHANDHITITKAGTYEVTAYITANSIAGAGAIYEFEIKKNNGTSRIGSAHADRTLAGGGSESGSITLGGIDSLSVNDTVEVWVKNEDNTQNIIIEDITLIVKQKGG